MYFLFQSFTLTCAEIDSFCARISKSSLMWNSGRRLGRDRVVSLHALVSIRCAVVSVKDMQTASEISPHIWNLYQIMTANDTKQTTCLYISGNGLPCSLTLTIHHKVTTEPGQLIREVSVKHKACTWKVFQTWKPTPHQEMYVSLGWPGTVVRFTH